MNRATFVTNASALAVLITWSACGGRPIGYAWGPEAGVEADGGRDGRPDADAQPWPCGNGAVEGAEECDDGDHNSDTLPDACRMDCRLPRCGDGVVDSGESCDLGSENGQSPEPCRGDCLVTVCGDGYLGGAELCDDGNTTSGDGCAHDCLSDESCGNGVVDAATGEVCDCGTDPAGLPAGCNAINGDPTGGCDAVCAESPCGNGVQDPGEVCDDGNHIPGDGCSADCLSDETCGNGAVDAAVGEACDDENLASHDGCSSGCTVETLQWVEITPAVSPPSNIGHALAYDSARRRMVLFGRNTHIGPGPFWPITWELDGSSWTEIFPVSSPVRRSLHSMVFDSAREVVVLYGGAFGGSYDDTWEFDGQSWLEIFTSSSPGLEGGKDEMVYDSVRSLVVFFTGEATWEFDGAEWTEATPPISPPTRDYHAAAYDSGRRVMVLFGGRDMYNDYSDTWEYDGISWVDTTPAVSPPSRGSHVMVYDAARGRVVMFGGALDSSTYFGDTWEYDGVTWVETTPALSPSPRSHSAMAYDSHRKQAVLFGGGQALPPQSFADTWTYRYESGWPEELCDNSADDDQDGLIDCADPDCEGMTCAGGGSCAAGACQ